MGFIKNLVNPLHHDKINTGSLVHFPKRFTGVAEKAAIRKYQQDPVRTTKQPDTIGSFIDPMAGYGYYTIGVDVTNTGA
jgi:hypothetical protein